MDNMNDAESIHPDYPWNEHADRDAWIRYEVGEWLRTHSCEGSVARAIDVLDGIRGRDPWLSIVGPSKIMPLVNREFGYQKTRGKSGNQYLGLRP